MIRGYTDRLSARAGETVRAYVSTDAAEFRASFVRLRRGFATPSPDGSLPYDHIATEIDGVHPGLHQEIVAGSYLIATGAPIDLAEGVTIAAWVRPSMPGEGEQGIVSLAAGGIGIALVLDETGRPALVMQRATGRRILAAATPARRNHWRHVVASYNAVTGEARVIEHPAPRSWLRDPRQQVSAAWTPGLDLSCDGTVLVAARDRRRDDRNNMRPYAIFAGRIAHPRIWTRALNENEADLVAAGNNVDCCLAGEWDFSADMAGATITDQSGAGRHARVVNMPTRAMTGPNWTGDTSDWRQDPAQWGAIHFHDTDLEDAEWEPAFELRVPEGATSGIYAVRVEAAGEVDYLPVVVRPRVGQPGSRGVFLLPTNTYLAYANEHLMTGEDAHKFTDKEIVWDPADHFLIDHPEYGLSCYDKHRDGSGVTYSSHLRPVVNMRPDYVTWISGGPRHFACDLHLLEFFDRIGESIDVITDEDLHREGIDLLRPYAVLLTGNHPEYWTSPAMDALEGYLTEGGRLMYLGGNGFYWVTGMDAERPYMVEVRRGYAGTRCWESEPGEVHLALTGEPGGLWRFRGRFPQKMTGVGFTAQGWGSAVGYERTAQATDERASWVLEGVAERVVGDFGLVMGGAAGDELDRADPDHGTPDEAIVIATSQGRHSDFYQLTIEDAPMMLSGMGGTEHPKVRADMVLVPGANGGAVFSVGSITWLGSLPHNGFVNNVARITENVYRRFATR
jgi:N,N-dimethylformamidase